MESDIERTEEEEVGVSKEVIREVDGRVSVMNEIVTF